MINITSDDPILIGYLLGVTDAQWDSCNDRYFTTARMDYRITSDGFYVNPVLTLVAVPSDLDLEMATAEEEQAARIGLPDDIAIELNDKQAKDVGRYFQDLINETEIYLMYKGSDLGQQIDECVTWKEVTICRDPSIWTQ